MAILEYFPWNNFIQGIGYLYSGTELLSTLIIKKKVGILCLCVSLRLKLIRPGLAKSQFCRREN